MVDGDPVLDRGSGTYLPGRGDDPRVGSGAMDLVLAGVELDDTDDASEGDVRVREGVRARSKGFLKDTFAYLDDLVGNGES